MEARSPSRKGGWQEVATLDFLAVDRHRVDLGSRVFRANEAIRPPPVGDESHHHDIALARSPFALGPQQLPLDLEDQVVAAVLDKRSTDRNVQLRGVKGNGGFRQV